MDHVLALIIRHTAQFKTQMKYKYTNKINKTGHQTSETNEFRRKECHLRESDF